MYNKSEKESRGNTENFVVFGTAFPETTDKDRRAGRSDAGQFVPQWKQEARDEQGRRRFHGAFTGGFSAGYYNTVGSKEGWEPSNFVSSRTARNELKEARPEDFMDEEDLAEMAGARKLVATEEFDILGGTKRELAAREKQLKEEEERGGGLGFLGTSLIGMIGPSKDSVGVRLLRKMGWRPGQGIGPRTHRQKKDAEDESDDDDDELVNNITFAPRDTPIENFQPKRDTYGLGYDLSASVPEVAEMKRLRELARQKDMMGETLDKKKRSTFGVFGESGETSAFGLGAFDEENAEQDNVYDGSSSIQDYHHTLYDDEDGLTRDQIKIEKNKRKRQQLEAEKESSTHGLKCSDGRLPLKGFHLSTQKQQIGRWHPPPKVPAEFTGRHVSKSNTPKATKIDNESIFSFEERGNVLGEKPIEQRSVFDYMPKHSKDKLDQAVGWFIDSGKDKTQLSDFVTIAKDVASLALKGFMPFGDNLKKQARYRGYLENQAGMLTEDGQPLKVLPIPEGLTYETGMKEMNEFAKAARIFRPISAMMSGRFTSASETTKHVELISFEGGLKTEEQYRKEREERAKAEPELEKKQLSQEAEAAAMKMFGNLTRTVKPFYPNRLVCKRFNVRNPHPNHDPTTDAAGRTQTGSKDALSKESMESLLNERLPLNFTTSSTTAAEEDPEAKNDPLLSAVIPKPSGRKIDAESSKEAPVTGIEKAVDSSATADNEEEGPPLDYERPSMDIFKAIFDDSDSDSEEEEESGLNSTNISNNEKALTAMPMDKDNFIGPPAPPPVATLDIPLKSNNASTDPSTDSSKPFRPMFKRASERKEQYNTPTNVVSEEFIVQPFKPRESSNKRRYVHVSEDEEKEEESSKYSSTKHSRKEKTSSRHHKNSSSSSSSRKRSRSPNDKTSRDRSRSSDRRHRKSKSSSSSSRHKKSKKDKDRDSDTSSRRHHKHEDEKTIADYEDMWVEKEPVIIPKNQEKTNSKKPGRMSAADMW